MSRLVLFHKGIDWIKYGSVELSVDIVAMGNRLSSNSSATNSSTVHTTPKLTDSSELVRKPPKLTDSMKIEIFDCIKNGDKLKVCMK